MLKKLKTNARRTVLSLTLGVMVVLGHGEVFMSDAKAAAGVRNILLVHGGFVDGSGWEGVYDLLKKDGYHVSIVQNPTTSLADDVAVTKRMLAAQNALAATMSSVAASRILAPASGYVFPSEKFVYSVQWRFFTAGTSTVAIGPSDKVERVTATANSVGFPAKLFPVHDIFDADVDPRSFCTLKIAKHSEEGPHRREHPRESVGAGPGAGPGCALPRHRRGARRTASEEHRPRQASAPEQLPPRRLVYLFPEKCAPIREPLAIAERGAPVLTANAITGREPRQHSLAIARDPRHHRFGAAERAQRLCHHRRVIAVAVLQLDPVRRKKIEGLVQRGVARSWHRKILPRNIPMWRPG